MHARLQYYCLRIHRPEARSRISVVCLCPPSDPGKTKSIRVPNRNLMSSTDRAGRWPLVFALVETMAPSRISHRRRTNGCAVTRTASVACSPVNQFGQSRAAGSSQVVGPGQLLSNCRDQPSRIFSTQGSSCRCSEAIRMRPFRQQRFFKASRRWTALPLAGSQPSPNTASVG